MTTVTRVWTREDALAIQEVLPEGMRCELIDGALLVSPAPKLPHQAVLAALSMRLYEHCRRTGVGRVLMAPADISLARELVLQPDLYVVPGEDFRHGMEEWRDIRRLLLVIEELSPSTASYDRGRKREFYQRERVPEYWIVDHSTRRVERWRPEDERPEMSTKTLTWQPVPTVEPLVIDLPELFTEAIGAIEVDPDDEQG